MGRSDLPKVKYYLPENQCWPGLFAAFTNRLFYGRTSGARRHWSRRGRSSAHSPEIISDLLHPVNEVSLDTQCFSVALLYLLVLLNKEIPGYNICLL